MVIKSENIITLIKEPQNITSSDVDLLDSILIKFPYFHAGQILITKGLQNTNSKRFNQQLRKAATFTLQRKKLFKIINLNKISNYENTDAKEISTSLTEEKLELGKPLKFYENESHSFSEWLTILKIKKIDRSESDIVDEFIQKNIHIKRPQKEAFFKATDIAKESLISNDELVTPTLAQVYLEQGHYKKAISAYEKLILKYPKKSSLFANKIKLISKLNNK